MKSELDACFEDYDKFIKEHFNKIKAWQDELEREFKFMLFGFGFCIGVLVGYFI